MELQELLVLLVLLEILVPQVKMAIVEPLAYLVLKAKMA